MRSSLFRSEAVDAQASYSLGRVHLYQLPYGRYFTLVILLLTIGLIFYVCIGEYTRKSSVSGVLTPLQGIATINADLDGVIKDLYVREGDLVEAGAPLALIQPQLYSNDIQNINTSISNSLNDQRVSAKSEQENLEQQKQHALETIDTSLSQLQFELKNLQAELGLASEQVDVQNDLYQKYSQLSVKGYVSKLDLQRARKELLAVKMAKIEREQRVLSLQRQMEDARQSRLANQYQFDQRLLSINQKVADYDQQITYQKSGSSRLLIAPIKGYITNVIAYASQPISSKQTLMNIVPQDLQLQADLYIPTTAAGFVKKDQAVKLKIAAFPYQKYGTFDGRIVSISNAVLPLRGSEQNSNALYLAKVDVLHHQLKIGDESFSLKSGMQLQADIEVDRRHIIEWIFEPIVGLAKRI